MTAIAPKQRSLRSDLSYRMSEPPNRHILGALITGINLQARNAGAQTTVEMLVHATATEACLRIILSCVLRRPASVHMA